MLSVASLGAMWRMSDAIYGLQCGDSGAEQMWLARCVSLDADDMTFKSRDFDAQQRRLSLRPFAGRFTRLAAVCSFVCLFVRLVPPKSFGPAPYPRAPARLLQRMRRSETRACRPCDRRARTGCRQTVAT
jgi:hypothetical protein